MRVIRRWVWLAAAVICLLAPAVVPTAQAEEPDEPAKLKVRGYGFFGNRALARTLDILRDADAEPSYYTASQIEDAALILTARLQQDGYLQPEVKGTLTFEDGSTETYRWDEDGLTQLPRPMRAVRVEFRVDPGLLYYYESVEFEGLTALDEEEARDYFIATGFLIQTRRARMFTPEGLERGLSNLREVLMRDGYERARVTASRVKRDDETGAVEVRVLVREGPRSIIRSARTVVLREGKETRERERDLPEDLPYSKVWTQDHAQELRARLYRLGYPDTEVTVEVENRETVGDEVHVDLVFTVVAGPYVEVGEVVFRGAEKSRESMMRRRVGLSQGDPLDRVQVDQGRFRLARLGIFDWLDVELEEVDESTRNVVYTVREGKEIEVNLLFGYGSYEMLRAGVELEQFNIFGRAHRSRLLLVQSMRSSSGDYRYTVPELFGEDIHGFSQLFALRREERDFDRIEYGGMVGLQTLFHPVDVEAALTYTYQLLESRDFSPIEGEGLDRAVVAAVGLDLQRDRRDNPIYPEDGNSVSTQLEFASRKFGGEVDYQRAEVGGSFHKDIGKGRYVHAALRHGVIHTFGEVASEIPFNRRFFMGGERTVRGYVQGEASPRNSRGEIVGSETYALLNVELEQALTQRWSAILFSDSIGIARDLRDYPFDEELYSVGLGIRYKTFIGPIRLEYGHNLNRRPRDPRGAIHLSIGFPF